jgi:hypothetical protein
LRQLASVSVTFGFELQALVEVASLKATIESRIDVGDDDGAELGTSEEKRLGNNDGDALGTAEGWMLGCEDGTLLGTFDGIELG